MLLGLELFHSIFSRFYVFVICFVVGNYSNQRKHVSCPPARAMFKISSIVIVSCVVSLQWCILLCGAKWADFLLAPTPPSPIYHEEPCPSSQQIPVLLPSKHSNLMSKLCHNNLKKVWGKHLCNIIFVLWEITIDLCIFLLYDFNLILHIYKNYW